MLPPTSEVFLDYVHRVHIQAAILRATLEADPPTVDHTHGWTKDDGSLVPLPLTPDVKRAPDEVLKIIRYGCSSDRACSTAQCCCSAATLSCSVFCGCRGGVDCFNTQTKSAALSTDDDEEIE